MKATRRRTPSGQRVFAGCVGVGGVPDAPPARSAPPRPEGSCQLTPTVRGPRFCRRIDFRPPWDLVQVPVVHGAGQSLYSPPQFTDIVERAVVSEMLAA